MQYADEYIETVLKDAYLSQNEYGIVSVPSAFIGGGTPSVLSEAQLTRLITGLKMIFPMGEDMEFTMEANPGTVNRDKLSLIKSLGVNRISFGAQASQMNILKTLGRIHVWDDVVRAVEDAQSAGFQNINLDLMYALPGQTTKDFSESIQKAIDLPITHISMYSLILEPGTPLYERAENGEVDIPGDDVSIDMQRLANSTAEKAGMKRYEISNYAYPGYECRHNICYWTRENYLGIGAGAHSLMNEIRFSNPHFSEYMKGERKADIQPIPLEERMEESVMLETRMTRGLDLLAFEQHYGRKYVERISEKAVYLQKAGLLNLSNDYLSLTEMGMDIQNAVVVKLLEALET